MCTSLFIDLKQALWAEGTQVPVKDSASISLVAQTPPSFLSQKSTHVT